MTNLKVNATSPNSIEISWQPPKQQNGIITGYSVTVFNQEQGSNITSLDANTTQWNISQGIGKFINVKLLRPQLFYLVCVCIYSSLGSVIRTLELALLTLSVDITMAIRSAYKVTKLQPLYCVIFRA